MASDQPHLFTTTPQRKPKAPDQYPGETRRLMGVYVMLFTEKFHEAPNLEPKHGALLKRLVTKFGPAKVEERLRFFIRWQDPFVEEAGHTLGVFNATWDRVTAVFQKLQQHAGGTGLAACGHLPSCHSAAEHSRRLLAEMKAQGQTALSPSAPFRVISRRSEAS